MEPTTLAEKVRLGLRRSQVLLGHERFEKLARRGLAGLVWATEDLSPHASGKLAILCARHGVPFLQCGKTDELGAITGAHTTKVYVLKKSFAGLKYLLLELRRTGQIEEGEK